ncbi:general stress protein [Dokdonia sinensis]|uniref:General stress protein n=1 Tax=Dokdonia sinensis TaxID=2479847 RepID=A0A3M0GZQ8_9FLAO|nr:pyridoxamine 5'-phosphate oxidase family protein [Dokdonia sinensis]RMB62826.1 general stress protein [Dokdonia sinensis]
MSTENLYSKEAKAKIKELVEDIDFAMMTTNLGQKPLGAIPMSTKKVDEAGNIWFLSGADSDHNKDIQKDSDVQLLYSKPSDMEFLSVFGKAVITRDKKILEDLYGKSDDNWFDGVDDPNLTAISFKPTEARYWDTKHNKFVSLFKMLYGTVAGEKTDIGVSGTLKP